MAHGITRGIDNLNIGAGVLELTPSDEEPLTRYIIDFVSERLNTDWQRFAVEYLSDEIIQNIDSDVSGIYEKCLTMLRKWNETSEVPVTKAMLKLRLQALKRNDIIFELTQKQQMTDTLPQRNQSQVIRQINVSNNREPTITDLKIKDINKLQLKLDPSFGSGISNWTHLAHEIMGDSAELTRQIKDLELHYCGGGNPALNFLSALSTSYPKVTVEQFQDVAKDLQRNDLFIYIDETFPPHKKQILLRDISIPEKEQIASLLNMNIPGIHGWEMFADEYNYSYTEINNMKATIKSEGSYSPTKRLFRLLREDTPNLTLKDLCAHCKKLSRNDVVIVLNEIIQDIKIKRS